MKTRFDPRENLIIVSAKVTGPKDSVVVKLALDTGASSTLIDEESMELIGYSPNDARGEVDVITGSGVARAPQIEVRRIEALGVERRTLTVLCHDLPAGSPVDGLLGLDFLRKRRLKLDFKKGIVTLD